MTSNNIEKVECTIKTELESTQRTLYEMKESLISLEHLTNEICGPSNEPESPNKEALAKEPASVLEVLQTLSHQQRANAKDLNEIYHRLRNTLG